MIVYVPALPLGMHLVNGFVFERVPQVKDVDLKGDCDMATVQYQGVNCVCHTIGNICSS